MPMQALVEQHPELFSGAQPEGVAFVTMELRPDGSVAESRLRHVPESEAPAVITATSKEMKKNFGLWILKSGTTIADATTRGPVNLFVTWQEPVPDEARFSKADVAAALERHLPDAVNRRGTSPRGTPWLVLSREGNVMRSGYIRLRNNAFDLNAFNSQVRDLTLCAYQIVQDVGTPGSGERARSVILAWVQDGAGARPVAAMSAVPAASPAPRQGAADLPRLLPRMRRSKVKWPVSASRRSQSCEGFPP